MYPKKCASVLTGHDGAVMTVRYNHDGKYCLSAGQDKTARLWNPSNGVLVKTYKGHGHEVLDVVPSHDNNQIVSCGGDRLIFLWDVASGRVIRRYRGHTQRVNALALNSESSICISGSYDATVRVWDLRSRAYDPCDIFEHPKDSVTSIICVGHEIIIGSVDGCVYHFDVRMGQLRVDHMGSPVTSVTLSHDGKCVLVGAMGTEEARSLTAGKLAATRMEGRILLLDQDSGSVLAQYTGHSNMSYGLGSALNIRDSHVLGGSETGDVLVWDLVNSKIVHKLHGHTAPVCGLSYHPEREAAVTSSFDGTVRVWE